MVAIYRTNATAPRTADAGRYADNDRDGIPNYRDPTPNGNHGNPHRDRDGDGVPDRYDARPDNPYRH
jgi:hypothetical protein